MGAGGRTNDLGGLDLDQVADFINARRADWTGSGLTAEPCTWLDQNTPWPRRLTTNRAAIPDPRSVGVILRNGDQAEGHVVVYAGGWADAEYVRFADDQDVLTECVEIDSPTAIGPLLDRVTRHLTDRQPPNR